MDLWMNKLEKIFMLQKENGWMDGWTSLIYHRTLNASSHLFCLLEGMRDVEG
jgi:hypothetical protein